MTIGERIKKIRLEKGLTQKQLAEKCGLFDSTIRKYESGRQNPKIETVEKIANALGISISQLTTISFDLPPGAGEKVFDFRDELEKEIDSKVSSLNKTGKKKALDYVTDLSEQEKYTKPDEEG